MIELHKEKNKEINTEEILKKYTKIKKLDRIILDEFITQIYVGYYNAETKSRKIKIEWKIN